MDSGSSFKVIDHPSDVGISFTAKTVEGLFESAAEGMFSIITDMECVEPDVERDVNIIRGPGFNIEDLIIIWLEELLYIHEVDNMLFSRFKVLKLRAGDQAGNRKQEQEGSVGESCIKARISGEKIDLEKHEIFISIKAPTYHMLRVSKDKDSESWKGQVIFDV